MKNMLNKNWIWIFIIVILLSGGYFAFSNSEGMTLERLCYIRESDGAKICIKGETSCIYFSDGSSKCSQGKNYCNELTSCAECTDKNAKPLGGNCFWNNDMKKCGSELETGYSPFCENKNTYDKTYSYIPIISLLPTSSLLNSAPANYYSN